MALVYVYSGWARNMTIDEAQIAEILADHESGKSLSEIAYFLRIPYSILWEICNGT